MKFQLSVSALLAAVQVVNKTVPKRAVQPVLSGLVLSHDRVWATDLDTYVSVPLNAHVSEPGVCLPDAKALLTALKSMNTHDVVTVSCSDGITVMLETQDLTTLVETSGLPADYPTDGHGTDMTNELGSVPAELLSEVIEAVSISASNESYNVLSSVYITFQDGAFDAVSTDGSWLNHLHRSGLETLANFKAQLAASVLNAQVAPWLKNATDLKVAIRRGPISKPGDPLEAETLRLTRDDGGWITMRCVKGQYPAHYPELFPKNPNGYAKYDRKALLDAAKACIKLDRRAAFIALRSDGIVQSVKGEYCRQLPVETDNALESIVLNAQFLSGFLTAGTGPVVRIEHGDKATKPVICHSDRDGMRTLIMPCVQVDEREPDFVKWAKPIQTPVALKVAPAKPKTSAKRVATGPRVGINPAPAIEPAPTAEPGCPHLDRMGISSHAPHPRTS